MIKQSMDVLKKVFRLFHKELTGNLPHRSLLNYRSMVEQHTGITSRSTMILVWKIPQGFCSTKRLHFVVKLPFPSNGSIFKHLETRNG